jgi:hypothetical protein
VADEVAMSSIGILSWPARPRRLPFTLPDEAFASAANGDTVGENVDTCRIGHSRWLDGDETWFSNNRTRAGRV